MWTLEDVGKKGVAMLCDMFQKFTTWKWVVNICSFHCLLVGSLQNGKLLEISLIESMGAIFTPGLFDCAPLVNQCWCVRGTASPTCRCFKTGGKGRRAAIGFIIFNHEGWGIVYLRSTSHSLDVFLPSAFLRFDLFDDIVSDFAFGQNLIPIGPRF